MKKLLIIMLCISSWFAANAQSVDRKWALDAQVGVNEYYGDFQKQYFFKSKAQDFHFFGGVALNRYLNKSFDLSLASSFGKWAGTIPSSKYVVRFSGTLLDGSLALRYKLNNGYIFNEKSKFAPFISAGIGYGSFGGFDANDAGNKITKPEAGGNLIIPIGVGLKYNLSESMAVQYQALLNLSSSDTHDNTIYKNSNGVVMKDGNNDNFIKQSIALVFSFGKAKDTDGDGVIDRLDKCPGTPANVAVDAVGCPIDGDGDGVADYLDKCPGTPASVQVDASGCPVDTDKDGIADYLDSCPNEKGTQKMNGCPDSDKDGVADKNDNCPNTPANTKVDSKGCPVDTDGDGVPDSMDKCPNDKGSVATKGCPDTDGDGITDDMDKCPDVKGTKANKGCPEMKQAVKEVFKKALQGIQFESGKDIIRKTSNSILDNIVEILKMNPAYKLTINGHTDNAGKADANQVLSQKRADAVKKYLGDKGVDVSGIATMGYGDTKPVADNKTAEGRTQNRRVEFVVEY